MPKPKSDPKPKKTAPGYKQLRDELDAVLAELQREDLDVDEALEHYRRGLDLVRQLEKYLTGAENKIREIKGKFDAK
jgi:exodeoxyribonuclease VII small subunit